MLKGVLYNVPVIVEPVGSAVAKQILHIDEKDGEGKVKFVLQSIFTQLLLASKESPKSYWLANNGSDIQYNKVVCKKVRSVAQFHLLIISFFMFVVL